MLRLDIGEQKPNENKKVTPIRPVIDLEAVQLRHKMFQESTPLKPPLEIM